MVTTILVLAFFAQALKETGIPSPGLSQSLLVYAGYEIRRGAFLTGAGIILLTLAGSLSGAGLIYGLAQSARTELLAKIYKYAGINPQALEKAGARITKHSSLSVAIGRSIPGLMVPTSIVAGSVKMPAGKFLVGIIFPLAIWMAVLAGTGSTLQAYTPQIRLTPSQVLLPVGILVAAGVLAGSLALRKRTRRPAPN